MTDKQEQAIAFLKKKRNKAHPYDVEYYDMAISALKQEPICPSAGVDCEDCPAYEPCEDAVSRDEVHKILWKAIEDLEDLPSLTNGGGGK